MPAHKVQFSPSGRGTLAAEGSTILRAAELASEPVSAECGGRGACGRGTLAAEGSTILRAAELASEPVSAECGGRGACGRCLVRILQGQVPEYRVLRRESGFPDV